MLEDFIEVNKIKAKIVTFSNSEKAAKCTFFTDGKNAVLVVSLLRDMPNIKKVRAEAELSNLEIAEKTECEDITGYLPQHLPPISVYGVKVLIDERAMEKSELFFEVDNGKFLKIAPQEILKCNEDVNTAKNLRE